MPCLHSPTGVSTCTITWVQGMLWLALEIVNTCPTQLNPQLPFENSLHSQLCPAADKRLTEVLTELERCLRSLQRLHRNRSGPHPVPRLTLSGQCVSAIWVQYCHTWLHCECGSENNQERDALEMNIRCKEATGIHFSPIPLRYKLLTCFDDYLKVKFIATIIEDKEAIVWVLMKSSSHSAK